MIDLIQVISESENKIKLSPEMDKRRNYNLKAIKGLKERLNNESDFCELTFYERAIIICALKDFRKSFFNNSFTIINERLNKEKRNLQHDMIHTNKIKKRLDFQIEEIEKKHKEELTILQNRIHTLKIKNTSLENKVEKMKNVGNCKHSMKCSAFNEKELIYGKIKTCINCKEWDLSE